MNGAIIREWCDHLAHLFELMADLRGKANVLLLKCKITGAIMAHYPQTIGPDMIGAALALEAVGDKVTPESYYNAIIVDFQPMADRILLSPEEGATEDDIETLAALHAAYAGINRLQGTDNFAKQRAVLEQLIAKGPTVLEEEEENEEE